MSYEMLVRWFWPLAGAKFTFHCCRSRSRPELVYVRQVPQAIDSVSLAPAVRRGGLRDAIQSIIREGHAPGRIEVVNDLSNVAVIAPRVKTVAQAENSLRGTGGKENSRCKRLL